MKEVVGIGFIIPSKDDDYIALESLSSLADVDIAIFSPSIRDDYYNRASNSPYQGKTLFSESYSPKISEYVEHWKREFKTYLTRGGTLFVMLAKEDTYYAYTGTKETSGTGMNARVTNHVSPVSNYSFLSFNVSAHNSEGTKVVPKSNMVTDLYDKFKDLVSYEIYVDSDRIQEIYFTTKSGDRVLGGLTRVGEGSIVFLPKIDFDIPEHYMDTDDDESDETWNEKALQRGLAFKNCIVAIDKALRNGKEKSIKPEWVDSSMFKLKSAEIIKNRINKLKQEIDDRCNRIEKLDAEYEEHNSIQDLLYETGKPLENAVIKALKILGYAAENFNNGDLELDQVITSPDGDRYIGECEGKDNKDIDITKFRQLQDHLNADFEREEVSEKAYGLLIGNPQRLIEPSKRTLDFTAKCKTSAAREKLGLIKTVDLFNACRVIIENKNSNDYAQGCRDAIKNQLGGIVSFPEY